MPATTRAGARGREDDGGHRAHGIQALTASGMAIWQIVSVKDPALLGAFGFPPVAA